MSYRVPLDARPAASLLLLRPSDDGPGLQVLMLRRAERAGDARSGVWVFPGGVVDPGDRRVHAHVHGGDDAGWSARLGLDEGGLDYAVAALRESFEEVGLLLARAAGGAPVAPAHVPDWHGWRVRLHAGDADFADFCALHGLVLPVDRLAYHSHWLTPLGTPKRFDTRFFVAQAPAGQEAVPDGAEALELRWLSPQQALSEALALKMLPVTRSTLQALARFPDADAALEEALSRRSVPRILPRLAQRGGRREILLPGHPAWHEIGAVDTTGHGQASCEIVPGVPVPLSPRVLRVTAGNAGVMTGPGTNSYLVGAAGSGGGWTVIDPGPADPAHLQALLAAAGSRPIERILVTHTHPDHSPGAVALSAATGAPVAGRVAAHAPGQDPGFAPNALLHGGERLVLGEACTLRVLHTPGHASNHLCFLLEEEGLLFTGDHVMQGSTVVINPPDGDMAAYLASLRALQALPAGTLTALAPGHGFLVGEPQAVIGTLVEHRLRREDRVRRALGADARPLDDLLPAAYGDVDPALFPIARRSLLAHLLKLQADGVAITRDGGWCTEAAPSAR